MNFRSVLVNSDRNTSIDTGSREFRLGQVNTVQIQIGSCQFRLGQVNSDRIMWRKTESHKTEVSRGVTFKETAIKKWVISCLAHNICYFYHVTWRSLLKEIAGEAKFPKVCDHMKVKGQTAMYVGVKFKDSLFNVNTVILCLTLYLCYCHHYAIEIHKIIQIQYSSWLYYV